MAAFIFFAFFLILPLLLISQIATLFYKHNKNLSAFSLGLSFAVGMLVIAYLTRHYSFYTRPHTTLRRQTLFGVRCLWTYYCSFIILQLSAFYLKDSLSKFVKYIPPLTIGLGALTLLLDHFSFMFVK